MRELVVDRHDIRERPQATGAATAKAATAESGVLTTPCLTFPDYVSSLLHSPTHSRSDLESTMLPYLSAS